MNTKRKNKLKISLKKLNQKKKIIREKNKTNKH